MGKTTKQKVCLRKGPILTFLQLDEQRKSKYPPSNKFSGRWYWVPFLMIQEIQYSGLFSWRERSLYWSSKVRLLWKRPIKAHVCIMVFLFISMVLVSGGCEPLRKKFIRKKKSDKKTEIIPVLDPEDYPARMRSVESRYRYFYSIWQVWHKELMLELNKKNWKDNRINYDLNQLRIALLEIQRLVVPDKQEVVKQRLRSLQKVQDEMQKSFAIRSSYHIKRDMEKLDKKMWKEFRPRVIQGYLNDGSGNFSPTHHPEERSDEGS